MNSLAVTPLEDLVARATSGDHEAFAGLVDRTRALVCSIAMAILRDVDASQDVAQDVYLAVWRDLGRLRSVGSFLPWLRQMTRNRAHHVLRSQVRRRRVFADDAVDSLIDSAAASGNPGSQLLEDEQRRRLAEAMGELPDEAREVVTLYYREGQSVQQVATLLDLSPDVVKQRLHRARATLRVAVLDELGATLRATAPGVGFTAGVMTLIMGAPTSAATAGAVAASATKAGLSGAAQLLLTVAYGLPGLLGGYLGVRLGHQAVERAAADEHERRALVRVRYAAVTTLVLFCVSMPIAYRASRTPLVPAVCYIAFVGVLAELYLRRVPRIIEPRLAAERRSDPSAALRQRRQRRWRYLGFTVGAVGGALGLVAGLIASRGA